MRNWMRIELSPADMLARPQIGPGELTREAAHAEVQTQLDLLAKEAPVCLQTADTWRRGAKDDTVYAGPTIWTIYEHPQGEDPRRAAIAWVEDFADTLRQAGVTNIGRSDGDGRVAAW